MGVDRSRWLLLVRCRAASACGVRKLHQQQNVHAEIEKLRKDLKHARIKRDRVPGHDTEAKRRAEDRVAALEKKREEL